MKTLRWFFLAAVLACGVADALAQQDCPYLPEFKTLREQITGMPASKAVIALQDYLVSHENPEGCELDEIDRLLAERETGLFTLVLRGKQVPAQVVYRCNEFDPKTAQCRSPMEDGTAHAASAGVTPMAFPATGSAYRVVGSLPSAKLVGLYRVSLADALDGKMATNLGLRSARKWQATTAATALIAIYRTKGPWAYRKAIWYFE